MTTLCHLLDGSIGWEQQLALRMLLDRLAAEHRQVVAAVDSRADRRAKAWGLSPYIIHAPLPIAPLAAPGVARLVSRSGIDLIHAWGVRAAQTACAAGKAPVLLHVFDPAVVTANDRLLRTLSPRCSFMCSSGIVQRRLVEHGVPIDRCVVIRPGIDFAAINQFRRSPLRDQLDVPREQRLVVTLEPTSPRSGAFEAFWAAALVNQLDGAVRIIVPGASAERDRIARFAAGLPGVPTLLSVDSSLDMEELICASDVLLAAPYGDVSTTALAWAMAASVAVIGSAVPAVAELIVHKVNGLLFKPPPRRGAIVDIVERLRDRDSQTKLTEAARGQAYEVFSARRFLDQTTLAYENAMKGAPVAEGVADPAVVAS